MVWRSSASFEGPAGSRRAFAVIAAAGALLLPMAGCKSANDKAVDRAKLDAAATGQPYQVVTVAGDGRTTDTVVAPPQVAGQPVTVNSATTAAGAPLQANLPDYSNGARPAPGNTVTFSGPKTGVASGGVAGAPAAPGMGEPGTVTGTAAVASAGPGASGGSGAAGAAGQGAGAGGGWPVAVSPAPTTGAPAVAPVVSGAVGGEAAEAAPADFEPTRVTLPAGTGIAIRINQTLSVKHTHAGDRFTGALAETVRRNGRVVLPRGTRFNGVVTEAHKRGHFKGHSELGLRLTSMVYQGKTYPIETAGVVERKKGKGKRTGALMGGAAGVGMLVGGVATGGVGLAVGALAGGGLGTFLAGVTGNKDITIPAETLLRFRLEDGLTVQPAD